MLRCSQAFRVFLFVVLTTSFSWCQTAERFVVLDGTSALAHVFDSASNTELASVNVGATPGSVIISPNGRLAFVSNLNSQSVSVIDFTINAEIKRIRNIRAFYMAITADGSQIVATDPINEQIYVIDTNSLALVRTISLNGLLGDDPSSDDLGFNNLTIANNKVYINSSDAIGVVSLATSSVMTVNSPLGARTFSGAESIATTADGKYVVAVRGGGTVIINPADDSVVQTTSFAGFSIAASGPVSDPAHNYIYLLRNSGGPAFSIVDMASASPTFGQIIATAPLPAGLPLNNGTRLSSSLDGSHAYVTVQTRNTPNVLVIDTAAVLSNPSAAVSAQLQVGVQARGSVAGQVQTQVSSTAPVVSGVNVPLVTNDTANIITVTGTGFVAGAKVRIGNLDPVDAQVLSATSLQATVPQSAAAQGAAIVVTNPNLESGILRGAFIIASKRTFEPANQVGVTNFADSTFSVLNVSTNATLSPAIPTAASPMGIAITPDGARGYIEGFFSPASVDVYNFGTDKIEAHVILNGDLRSTPGQIEGIALAPLFGSNHLAAYVVSGRQLTADPTFSEELYVIDADPTSTTFNTVINTVPTGGPVPSAAHGALAVTPDGHYAFINEFRNDTVLLTGNLIILDITTGASTVIPASTLGISDFQPNMELSLDGKLLTLIDNSGGILVMDVGTDPTNPTLKVRIQGTAPQGLQPLGLGFQRIVGKRLFAFDQVQNVVDIFNFDPAANNFSELGAFGFSAAGTDLAIVPDVTPDGSLMYIPLREEDAVAVIDVAKALANDPLALVTKIGTGIAPTVARVRPGTPTPAGISVPVQPIPQVALTFDNVTGSGATSVSTTNTNPDPLPAGFALGTPPLYYEISSTATFTGNIQVCISYNPAQFTGAESGIRLLHDDGGSFVDVTTSLDTANHVVCGSVTHFSAFTVGLGSTDFLFDSLLKEIRASVTDRGDAHSLSAKVQAAHEAFDRGQGSTAGHQLNAFENEVQAKSGKTLSAAEAQRLLSMANAILGRL